MTADHEQTYSVVLDDRGRLVLPAALRRRLALETGDRLIITPDSSRGFHVVSARIQAEQLRGWFRDRFPESSPLDDLIAERRAEAQAEDMY